jgi:hypothetical protein
MALLYFEPPVVEIGHLGGGQSLLALLALLALYIE